MVLSVVLGVHPDCPPVVFSIVTISLPPSTFVLTKLLLAHTLSL